MDKKRKERGDFLYKTLDLVTMGYLNLMGTIKALLKGAVINIIISLSIITAFFMIFIGSLLGNVIAVAFGWIIFAVYYLFLPIIQNVNLILRREYILNESRIGLSEAIKEARERLNGRWVMYYLKRIGVDLLSGLAIFLCVISIIGILVIPVVVSLFAIVQLSLAYQNEIGPTQVIKDYFRELFFLSLVLSLITLVSGLAPVAGQILITPALCASSLFVALKFD